MTIEFYNSNELDKDQTDHMWSQGVNMDDWDYMLIVPDNVLVKESYEQLVYDECGRRSVETVEEFGCKDYNLGRLLTGCCSNKWHIIKHWDGRTVGCGVAYHS